MVMEPVPESSSKVALVRPPASSLADGLTTLIDASPVDVALANEQWHDHVQALTGCGWTIRQIDGDDDCADSVFIEDTAVVHGDLAVICNPGADSRKPEVPPVAAELTALGYRLMTIDEPGTLDGGDVLKVGDTIYIGVGHRTNTAGVAQAAAAFATVGATVVPVENRSALHLKSAVTALPDGTIIGWEPFLDDPTVFPDFMAMPEEAGAHVVDLGEGQLLMSAGAPLSMALLANRGWTPIPVEISEFEKLEGCVTCLSIRLRGLDGLDDR